MKILRLEQVEPGSAGGKVEGLRLLHSWGFDVPQTFVVSGTDYDDRELKHFVSSLPEGKRFAVRSSASVEDGGTYSFAGQFETLLDVDPGEPLLHAVKQCFDSVLNQRSQAYKGHLSQDGVDVVMNVIIQRMVDAEFAGVLFTADPVQNRHDMCVLSITQGQGEALMSGRQGGRTFRFYKHDAKAPDDLPRDLFFALAHGSLAIEKKFGRPADLEFAVDRNGRLYWLQLRPVTGLVDVHMNELDDRPLYPKPVYTRGNVGEMMPGPVTPLTASTFVRAIDLGLQRFYKTSGAVESISTDNLFVHKFYNHLFFEVNSLYLIAQHALLATKENIDSSVVGAVVPGIRVHKVVSFPRALLNLFRMYRYVSGGGRAARRLRKLYEEFRLDCPQTALECWQLIDRHMEVLFRAYDLHYVSSSQSGSYFSAVVNIISKGKIPRNEHQQQAARFFTDIPGIESARVLRAIDNLAGSLARMPGISRNFLDVSMDDALLWLQQKGPESVRERWNAFLARHGHRCVREAELREKEWAVDPVPVVQSLQAKTRLLLSGAEQDIPGNHGQHGYDFSGLNLVQRLVLKLLLPRARVAVARREQTKAWAVGVQYQFKMAYRVLSNLMVRDGLLADPDQVYFLTHQELGHLLQERNGDDWMEKANLRRNLYPRMQQLSFPDLVFGVPVPLETADEAGKMDGQLTGIPVSRGKVTGKVRIVRSQADARMLQKGEIMVSEYTDIGWTPYYSIIGGLITEIGSPLSHGAVVAREYGIPAVVGMKSAMSMLKNGQEVTLDAYKGIVLKAS